MNFVEIAGHLGADPEERFTKTGKRVISLRVATKVRQGGKDETIWWRVNIWENKFDHLLPFLKKGSAVVVRGELMKPEVYTDKSGKPQVSLTISAESVRFSPFGKGKEGERGTSSPAREEGGDEVREEMMVPAGVDESGFTGDDLPF